MKRAILGFVGQTAFIVVSGAMLFGCAAGRDGELSIGEHDPPSVPTSRSEESLEGVMRAIAAEMIRQEIQDSDCPSLERRICAALATESMGDDAWRRGAAESMSAELFELRAAVRSSPSVHTTPTPAEVEERSRVLGAALVRSLRYKLERADAAALFASDAIAAGDAGGDATSPWFEPEWDAPEGFVKVDWRTLAEFDPRRGEPPPARVRALKGSRVAIVGYLMTDGEDGRSHVCYLRSQRWPHRPHVLYGPPYDLPFVTEVVHVRVKGDAPPPFAFDRVMLTGLFEVEETVVDGETANIYRLDVDGPDAMKVMTPTQHDAAGRVTRIEPASPDASKRADERESASSSGVDDPRAGHTETPVDVVVDEGTSDAVQSGDGADSAEPDSFCEPDWDAPEGFTRVSWKTLTGFEPRSDRKVPAAIRSLGGKTVALCGYMWLLSETENLREFMLMSLKWPKLPRYTMGPSEFPKVTEVVVVRVVGETPLQYTSKPVMISGRFDVDVTVENGEVDGVYRIEVEGPSALTTMDLTERDAVGRVTRIAASAPIKVRPAFGPGPPWYDEPEWSAPEGFEKVRWRTLAGFAYAESKGFAFDVWRLSYKRVALSGFIVPNDDGKDLREFRFAPERTPQKGAAEKGEANLNQFVLVRVPYGLAVDDVTDRVVLTGRFFVGEERRGEQVTSVYRLELSGPEGVVRRK